MNIKGLSLLTGLALSGMVVTGGNFSPAQAVTYNATHFFNFNVGGNTTPGVFGFDSGYASAFSPYVFPPFQQASYANSFTLPPNRFDSRFVSRGGASAFASSTVSISTLGIGTVSGLIQSYGFANVGQRGESAFSASTASVTARQRIRLPFGFILWGPNFAWDFVSGSAYVRKDPITFKVTDPNTGNLLDSGTFLDVVNTGDGTVNWNDTNIIDFAINNGTFKLTLDSPFIPVAQRGSLLVEANNGTITRSETTGIYSGLLPQIGNSSNFSIQVPQIQFDYSLPDYGQDVDVEITGSGGVSVVPEPSSLLGLVGVGFLGGVSIFKRKRSH